MEDGHHSAELVLLEGYPGLELKVVKTEAKDFMGVRHVRVTLKDEPNILATSALSLVYMLGAFSFRDARPRGFSENFFDKNDDWYAADMLAHVSFEDGQLHFYADYVRGRMMKTTIEVHPDGTVVVDTVDRGDVAKHWVATLTGKRKALSLISTKAE